MEHLDTSLTTLKSLPACVAILDASGTIVGVNDTWKEFGLQNGLRIPNSAIGANYLEYCGPDEIRSLRFIADLRALLAGQLDLLTFIYPCHSRIQKRWFSLIGLPLSLDRPAGAALLHVNVTDALPAAINTQPLPVKTKNRKRVHPVADLSAASEAVEHTVSSTLAAQLATMLAGSVQGLKRKKGRADKTTDQIALTGNRLSKRQMQVLRFLGEGKTNKEIADKLSRSPNTIKLHVSAILKQLNLKSRTQAALLASRIVLDS